jgi:hypothetical protein
MSNFIDGLVAAEIEHANQTRDLQINARANETRREHGATFEKYVDTLLVKSGLGCQRTRVKTSDGEKISDHTFNNVWMESTTFFDKKRVNEFILKKRVIEEATADFTKFFLFYERNITKLTEGLVEKLVNAGWVVLCGKNKIETFISAYGKHASNVTNDVIQVAKPQLIDIDLLIKNPFNREQNSKGVESIAKSIINEGFLTCLYVVPRKDKNGKITGYMLFEGHHRLSAAIQVRSWGFSLNQLPCVVVDWLSTDNMEKLSRLLIKINVEYRSWKLGDYIKHHFDVAELLIKDKNTASTIVKKQYSYQTLLNWMKIGKQYGFGDNGLIYILGPLTGSDRWLDQDLIRGGDYIVEQSEVENYATPFFDVMKNFISKAKQNAEYRKDVYQLFCCELYEKLKDGTVSLDEINNYFLAYNMLDSTEVPNKKSDVKNIYQKLDDNIKHFKNGFK